MGADGDDAAIPGFGEAPRSRGPDAAARPGMTTALSIECSMATDAR
jgi:hypothetical protein